MINIPNRSKGISKVPIRKEKTQGRNPFTLEIGFPSISKNKNALLDDSNKYIIKKDLIITIKIWDIEICFSCTTPLICKQLEISTSCLFPKG